MKTQLKDMILDATQAIDIRSVTTIQSLWSGYGSLERYELTGSQWSSVIVKHVRLPELSQHPRGWNTDFSHHRKLRSYQIETAWYQRWADHSNEHCRVPKTLGLEQQENSFIMILEDLSSNGFPSLVCNANWEHITACLKWLANFHATFLGKTPEQLWPVGTYWHLATRPDELAGMEEGALKQAASVLDDRLNEAPFQTFVHGDAKLANFCFSEDGKQVAAVDFQYVGGGCGMKDVAYFISSCLNEADCERYETDLLNIYFTELTTALAVHQPQINPSDVEVAWRPMYPIAWTDFYRFLKGWSPGHWKIHAYSERIAREVIENL
ncbi:phosphotransferase [Leucothrix pacifica]|uniref:Choline kinase n=1 Tax=Leucothrix pacifica TaxID=1247513 RepID=A0A317CKV0_9GAMM|nr:phosphotransferase [Leucothrix pacifica]PWQ99126.1 choline kinase [Leucothrix pacifica]